MVFRLILQIKTYRQSYLNLSLVSLPLLLAGIYLGGKKINCIILDDEPFAVKLMADYASKVPRLNVLYADSDVFKAIEILNNEVVDLVFIDIQMPQLTGIELMQMFNQKHNFIITSASRCGVVEEHVAFGLCVQKFCETRLSQPDKL